MVLFDNNAKTLPPKEALPYLGRTITYSNINWPAVLQNLKKARSQWGMISRVLTKIGETVWDHEMVYKAA